MIGSVVADRTARVTSADIWGSQPKQYPPWATLGHETLTSIAAIAWLLIQDSRHHGVVVYRLCRDVDDRRTVHFAHIAGYFLTNPWIPGFCNPIAFSIPAGVSTMRGIGFPDRRRVA